MKSVRNTTSKTAILELLQISEEALSQKDILTQLDGSCDRVTVYRVLDRLLEEGYVHKVVDVDGVMRFAACRSCEEEHHQHHHVHFSCQECGTVSCLEDIEPSVKLPDGYRISEANFTLSGLCPKCS